MHTCTQPPIAVHGHMLNLVAVVCWQVIESYSYFSLSVAMTLYLTDEFGISDLSVRARQLACRTHRRPRQTPQCAQLKPSNVR